MEYEEYKKIKQELDKLDKNYFHTNIKFDKDKKLIWSVYYGNMNSKNYFTIRNKAILNSRYNTIEDIRMLNIQFVKIQEEAKMNLGLDSLDLDIDIFKTNSEVIDTISKGVNVIGFSVIAFMLVMLLLNINTIIFVVFGFAILTAFIMITVEHIYIQDNIEKVINKLHKKEKDRLLKVYLKDKEMKGLRYEFTKKNREKFIEENKEYRQKRKRI